MWSFCCFPRQHCYTLTRVVPHFTGPLEEAYYPLMTKALPCQGRNFVKYIKIHRRSKGHILLIPMGLLLSFWHLFSRWLLQIKFVVWQLHLTDDTFWLFSVHLLSSVSHPCLPLPTSPFLPLICFILLCDSELIQSHPHDHRCGISHWSLVGLPVGTQTTKHNDTPSSAFTNSQFFPWEG